jgi:hypothetical protein
MNAIQQISLMLQMGIDPSTDIGQDLLPRTLQAEAGCEKY